MDVMSLSIVFALVALILAIAGLSWMIRSLGERKRPRFDHRRD